MPVESLTKAVDPSDTYVPQTTDTILMIRPNSFYCNPETMNDNVWQTQFPGGKRPETTEEEATFKEALNARATAEFDAFVANLRKRMIRVIVVQDTDDTDTPDSVFPNNWISFHREGLRVIYPMKAENRQTERQLEPYVVSALEAEELSFPDRIDFTNYDQQKEGAPLEGTGSMVLDRHNRIIYASLSERTVLHSLEAVARRLGYKVVCFDSALIRGQKVYHTNVLMSVGESVAILCDDAILRPEDRGLVHEMLAESGHDIVTISLEQLGSFAGNALEVRTTEGQSVWVMSRQAYNSLTDEQRAVFTGHGSDILTADLHTIETAGGGSARCMMAEVFYKANAKPPA